MLTNTGVTLYHKILNQETNLEQWVRYTYNNAWIFKTKGSSVNKGYTSSNSIKLRIPYKGNNIQIEQIDIGDIIVEGIIDTEIETQEDIEKCYNITSINNNNYGVEPHLHIIGA